MILFYKKIKQIINEWDRMSLFPYFPDNEYGTEIEKNYNSYDRACDKILLVNLYIKYL